MPSRRGWGAKEEPSGEPETGQGEAGREAEEGVLEAQGRNVFREGGSDQLRPILLWVKKGDCSE